MRPTVPATPFTSPPDQARLLVLPGDGIGPEVMAQCLRVLDSVVDHASLDLVVVEDLIGGQAWDAYGTFCRDETVATARGSDGVLCGAVGGPAYDDLIPDGSPEEKDGLMRLRRELDVHAGIRPAVALPHLAGVSPYRPEVIDGADLIVLREMCGGVMFASPRGVDRSRAGRRGLDTAAYDEYEIARHARVAFELARRRRGRVTSVDKANVMESGVLWREVVSEVATEFPDIELEHLYADVCSYRIAVNPVVFDVIVADNLFGDILSDQAGALAGSLAMLPSACLPGLDRSAGPGIYEPVHGSARTSSARGGRTRSG